MIDEKQINLELEALGRTLCPEDSQESPAFPNATDTDIWVMGFISGVENTVAAVMGDCSPLMKKWAAMQIDFWLEIKKHIDETGDGDSGQ